MKTVKKLNKNITVTITSGKDINGRGFNLAHQEAYFSCWTVVEHPLTIEQFNMENERPDMLIIAWNENGLIKNEADYAIGGEYYAEFFLNMGKAKSQVLGLDQDNLKMLANIDRPALLKLLKNSLLKQLKKVNMFNAKTFCHVIFTDKHNFVLSEKVIWETFPDYTIKTLPKIIKNTPTDVTILQLLQDELSYWMKDNKDNVDHYDNIKEICKTQRECHACPCFLRGQGNCFPNIELLRENPDQPERLTDLLDELRDTITYVRNSALYYIWCPTHGAPKILHNGLKEACNELRQLENNNDGWFFVIPGY